MMTTPAHDAFEFWESAFASDDIGTPPPRAADAWSLSLELQDGEWSEHEAAVELSRKCTVVDLQAAQSHLIATLQRSPVVLPRTIAASRAVWIALDIATADETAA